MIFFALGAAASDVFSLIALGISKITFGDFSKRFAEAADVLRTRAKEMSQEAEQSAMDIRDSYGNSYRQIGDATGAFVQSYQLAQGEIEVAAKKGSKAALDASREQEAASKTQQQALADVRKAAQDLGVDYDNLVGGISQKSQLATDAFRKLTEDASVGAAGLFKAFDAALQQARTAPELEALKQAYVDLFIPAADQVDQYNLKLADLTARIAQSILDQEGMTTQARAGAQALGLDYEQLTTRVSLAAKATIDQFAGITKANQDNVDLFVASYQAAFAKLSTSQEKDAFRLALAESVQPGIEKTEEYRVLLQRLELDISKTRGTERAAHSERIAELTGQREGLAALMQAADDRYAREVAGANLAAQEEQKLREQRAKSAADAQSESEARAAGLRSFAQSIGDYYAAVNNNLREMSDATHQLFLQMELGSKYVAAPATEVEQLQQRLSGLQTQLGDIVEYYYTYATPGLGALMTKTAEHANLAEQAFLQQLLAARKLEDQLNSNSEAAAQILPFAQQAVSAMGLLDSQDLSGLNAAIDRAKSKLQSLRDAAQDTVRNLNEQLADLQGNAVKAQQLRNEEAIRELETRIKDAQSFGDRESVNALQSALQTQREINAMQIEAAKRREEDQKKAPDASRRDEPAKSTKTDTIEVKLGRSGSIDIPASQRSVFEGFLRELSEAGRIST